jgi:phosphomannomutase
MSKIRSLKISISGVRGIVGETLTPQLIAAFAGAFGTYVGRGPILVGRDTRTSGEMFRNAVFAGLLSAGCEPVDLAVCPVPSIQIRTSALRARGAIAITASHNPVEWNALKFISSEGLFLSSYQAAELLDIYHQRSFTQVSSHELRAVRCDREAIDTHLKKLYCCFDRAITRRRRAKVVLDACNGAGSVAAPRFLRALGCEVIEINTVPNGIFPRNPEPVPENLSALMQAVVEHHADLGFAQDADADRLAVIDHEGIPIGEDYTLALAVVFVLERRKGAVVTNLSTSRAIEDIASGYGCPVLRTRIGEIKVVEQMIQCGAVVGGEGNGGVILPEVHYCRDSMTGMGAILQLMAERGRSLKQLLAEIPRYALLKRKTEFPLEHLSRLEHLLRESWPEAQVNDLDGVKLSWSDSWIHVRPSNTEPVLRLVAEAPTHAKARALLRNAQRLVASLKKP